MSLYKSYKTDNSKEVNGVPIEFAKNDDGSTPTILISRVGESNKAYMRALEAAQKPYRRQIQLGTMDKDVNERLFLELFARVVLKGWSNVQDENSADLPFTFENACKVLTDLPELYSELFRQANNVELFRLDTLEADAKN